MTGDRASLEHAGPTWAATALCALCALWGLGLAGCGDSTKPATTALQADAADSGTSPDIEADGAGARVDVHAAEVDERATGCPGGPGCPCEVDEDCDDHNVCTYGAACTEGLCSAGIAEDCDDANLCTQDACDPASGCTSTAVEHWCSDGDPCTVGDFCTGDTCTPGAPKGCEDGNFCTDNTCIPGQGCQYVDNKLECKPEDECAAASFCFMGGCVQGTAKPCDDGNVCTWNGCDPKLGCQYVGVPDASTCTDGVVAEGRCWKAIAKTATWTGARDFCHAWGGELASIRNKYDNQTARQAADGVCGKASAWIGLSDVAIEGQFVWADGETSLFRNWNSGEPNNAGDEDVTELLANGTWNDIGVGAQHECGVCSRALIYTCDDGNPCTASTTCLGGACLPASASASCDDGNGCTLDGCGVDLGCAHTAAEDGTACGQGGTCTLGWCAMPLAGQATDSCAGLGPDAVSGLYWLDLDGPGAATPTQVWCDMTTLGGGWALVLQVDGASTDSAYASPLWTDADPTPGYSPLPGAATARLPGYASMALSTVRLDLVVDGNVRSLVLESGPAANLRALLTGPQLKTGLGLLAWESLLPAGSLQKNCHLEGFQIASSGGAKLRLGIFGNNENDCGSVDSWLGVGATGGQCGVAVPPGAGNVACWGPDHGDAKTTAVARIYVR